MEKKKKIYVAIKYNCGGFKYAQSKFYKSIIIPHTGGNENLIFNTGIGI